MFERIETKSVDVAIRKQLNVTEVKDGIDLTSVDETIPQLVPDFESWPRPKVLSRNFEFAVSSLDTNGKKDLLSCAIMQTSGPTAREMRWNTYQMDAVIQFSSQKLSGVNLSNHTLRSKHTPQECEDLFSLVLGKT